MVVLAIFAVADNDDDDKDNPPAGAVIGERVVGLRGELTTGENVC